MACKENVSIDTYCAKRPETVGCPKPNPTDPNVKPTPVPGTDPNVIPIPVPELPVCCKVLYVLCLETCPMTLLSHDRAAELRVVSEVA